MKTRIAAIAVAFCLLASPALAGNWYLGGGFEEVDVGDDMGVGVDTGTGFTLNFGYRFSPNLALDFLWGASYHSDTAIGYPLVAPVYVGDDFGYGRFLMGANFILVPIGQIQPYVTVGLGSHAIVYDNFPDEVTGSSIYFGGGADLYLDPRNSIDVSIRFHSWQGDFEEDGWFMGTIDATATVISVCYNYHFLM